MSLCAVPHFVNTILLLTTHPFACSLLRVLVTAVDKSSIPMNIHYFNNCFEENFFSTRKFLESQTLGIYNCSVCFEENLVLSTSFPYRANMESGSVYKCCSTVFH